MRTVLKNHISTDSQSLILTVNAGSSSLKFDLFSINPIVRITSGVIDKIGQNKSLFTINNLSKEVSLNTYNDAINLFIEWYKHNNTQNIIAIGHRIVHGGPKYFEPCLATNDIFDDLKKFIPFDTEHLPSELLILEKVQKLFQDIPNILCFDTSFYKDLPIESKMLPIPRHYFKEGLRRYGFHGLSYQFVFQKLQQIYGEKIFSSRLIIAHLGNGVSISAIKEGKPIDTTMGFTPTGGVPMGTRSGDIDPGIISYIEYTKNLNTNQINHLFNFESGLLGISETTSDMKSLLDNESKDKRISDAINIFCYDIRKTIGGFIAILGGVDKIVFTGGIGENSPEIRKRICQNLEFMGILIDQENNYNNKDVISPKTSKVDIRVIHTDEAQIIAQNVINILNI